MADTLAQMEQRLQKYKTQYTDYHKYFSSVESWGGEAITFAEEQALNFIKASIAAMEGEIKRRKELLTKVTISDVKDHYALLHKKIMLFVEKNVDDTYLQWKAHLLSVGNCYKNAADIHEKTVTNLEKHKADVANIAGSIISVAGLGAFSWLSSTDKLLVILKGISKSQQNVIEDIVQGGWDKAISFGASKWYGQVKAGYDSPLVFQNTITKKVLLSYQALRQEILHHAGAALVCEEQMLNLQTNKTGSPKEEYEQFIAFESNVLQVLTKSNVWVLDTPPNTGSSYYQDLTDDFERGFWAKWLPGLRSVKTYAQPATNDATRYGKGDYVKKTEYDSWWWTTELCNRLTNLIDLKKIGVGENGLDSWVSGTDVKLLIAWAETFEQTVTY